MKKDEAASERAIYCVMVEGRLSGLVGTAIPSVGEAAGVVVTLASLDFQSARILCGILSSQALHHRNKLSSTSSLE